MIRRFSNYIYKTWDGRICDFCNDLHYSTATGEIHDRHNRFDPVPVTSTVWNAMAKACAIYNREVAS